MMDIPIYNVLLELAMRENLGHDSVERRPHTSISAFVTTYTSEENLRAMSTLLACGSEAKVLRASLRETVDRMLEAEEATRAARGER